MTKTINGLTRELTSGAAGDLLEVWDIDATGTDQSQKMTIANLLATPAYASIQASGSAGVAIKNSGGTSVLTVGAGGGTGVTAAGQINATGINFGNETLDGFREAVSFTPTIVGETTAGTNTYLVQEGAWHQIADKLGFVTVDVALTGAISSTGTIYVSLPFSGLGDNNCFGAECNAITFGDDFNILVNGNKAVLRKRTSGGVTSSVQHTDCGAGLRVRFSAFVTLA